MKHNSAGRLMVMLTAMQVVRVASEECGWQHVQGCGFVAVELWVYPYPELFVLGEVCIWIHILQAFFPTEILKPTRSWIILRTCFWPGPPWQCSREIMVSPWSPHVLQFPGDEIPCCLLLRRNRTRDASQSLKAWTNTRRLANDLSSRSNLCWHTREGGGLTHPLLSYTRRAWLPVLNFCCARAMEERPGVGVGLWMDKPTGEW